MENKKDLKRLFLLFFTFLKIGAFTFGGGYAMIALLENEFVSKRKWLKAEEFLDIVAIAESTPGPIAVNSATYIGYKTFGVIGSFFATLGVVLPSFIIIYTISFFFDSFLKFKYVGYAFKGIQVCVVYLIFSAGIKMAKQLKKDAFTYIVFFSVVLVFLLFSLFAVKFSTVFYILICGIIGLMFYGINKIKGGGD